MSTAADNYGLSMEQIYGDIGPWNYPMSPLHPGKHHTVLYQLPLVPNAEPAPHRNRKSAYSDTDHVRLPFTNSTSSTTKPRWEVIQESLLQPITSSHQLEAAMNQYYPEKPIPKLAGLHALFNDEFSEDETQHFFSHIFPGIVRLALSLPDIITAQVPLLKSTSSKSLSLSQKQIASLLANGFLCTFTPLHGHHHYESINFIGLFVSVKEQSSNSVLEKLKCLIHYFKRVLQKMPTGVVTFERKHFFRNQRQSQQQQSSSAVQHSNEFPRWDFATEELGDTQLHVDSRGTIEDARGLLQVDFANKKIGGGVLSRGCVQEEIRFVICPEMIVSRLFTEELRDNEALIIIGAERYSKYKGYSDSFVWTGNYDDTTPLDDNGRRRTSLVAIDALRFHDRKEQYKPGAVRRELNKAYAGFQSRYADPGSNRAPVATGNWGCGAFRGDPNLKWLIQLMACRISGRGIVYYTFGDMDLAKRIYDSHNFFVRNNVTVGQLWRYFCRFAASEQSPDKLIGYIQHLHLEQKTQPTIKKYLNLFKKQPTDKLSDVSSLSPSILEQSQHVSPQQTRDDVRITIEPDEMETDQISDQTNRDSDVNTTSSLTGAGTASQTICNSNKRKFVREVNNGLGAAKVATSNGGTDSGSVVDSSVVISIINQLNGDDPDQPLLTTPGKSRVDGFFAAIDAVPKFPKTPDRTVSAVRPTTTTASQQLPALTLAKSPDAQLRTPLKMAMGGGSSARSAGNSVVKAPPKKITDYFNKL